MGQTLFCGRDDNEVVVVRHETVGPELQAKAGRLVLQEGQIELVVLLTKEDGLAAVPTLGDVVGNVGDRNAGQARHRGVFIRQELCMMSPEFMSPEFLVGNLMIFIHHLARKGS